MTTEEKIDKILEGVEKLLAPKSSKASIAGFEGSAAPAAPVPKIYDSVVKRFGGIEAFAKAIRERTAGYPETRLGLIGAWDEESVVIAFKADYPQFF